MQTSYHIIFHERIALLFITAKELQSIQFSDNYVFRRNNEGINIRSRAVDPQTVTSKGLEAAACGFDGGLRELALLREDMTDEFLDHLRQMYERGRSSS